MKHITMDWQTYREEIMHEHVQAYNHALIDVIDMINGTGNIAIGDASVLRRELIEELTNALKSMKQDDLK